MSKLMRSNKKYGRCRTEGHGQECCVSQDIQCEFVPRSRDKYNHIREEFDIMDASNDTHSEPLLEMC